MEGYKQTEVGVIPEDWEIDDVENLAHITTGGRNTQDRTEGGQYPFFVRSQTIERINSYSFDGEAVLTAGDGVGTGKVYHYINGKFDAHQRVYRISDFKERIDGYFFYLYFSNRFYSRIMQMTAKSSVDSVRREMIARMPVPLPPKSEQEAIAEVLSNTDTLVESLEQLTAKKLYIKQGAMRELLTGKKRLPGFDNRNKNYMQTEVGMIPGDWEVMRLGMLVTSLDAGVSVNSVDIENDTYANDASILKTSCVAKGKFLPGENKKIVARDIHRVKLYPCKDSIVISRMNTPALVGECGYIDKDYPSLFLPDRLWMTRHESPIPHCVRWLAYILSYVSFNRFIKEAATGTSGSMKNISKASILAVQIPFPTIAEQEAIVNILLDIDTEIAALEAKLDKARQLKQGMMHNLLTGRIRLV